MDGTLISLPVEWDKVREELRRLTGTSLSFNPFFLDVQTVVAKDPLLLGPIIEDHRRVRSEGRPGGEAGGRRH